ncbi:MAG: hypothetical protein M5U28_44150 [Sandaracinaceae bacterium]|nr:hypothetical protein [Sandaracinaceae bacterium]
MIEVDAIAEAVGQPVGDGLAALVDVVALVGVAEDPERIGGLPRR